MQDGAFGGRQARRLLAILASRRGQVVNRDTLIDFLWGESIPADPGANLNAIVARLRKALDSGDLVHTTPNGYSLVDDDRCVVDIERFERDVRHGLELLRNRNYREAALVLAGSVEAWDEPFGEERYSDWAADPIRRLESLYMDALEGAARAASAHGDHTEAIRHAREAMSREPLRESAAVSLARAQARAGDRAAALETLDRHRRVLGSELGLEPSAQAAAVRDSILRDEIGMYGTIPGSGGLIHPTTPLVGRESELHQLERLLKRARHVTVTGPGGVGKTRLAIEAAGKLGPETWVVMCALDHVDHPDVVPHAVAHAADALDSPDRTVVGDIAAAFRDRETLLLLDGCDAAVESVANLAATLLARCPLLTVLVTSRERCGLPGEFILRLGPLDLGEGSAAVRLFVQRAAETDPSFRADQGASMVEEVCRILDGMPLALELAAAHLSSMSLRELLRRLEPLPPDRSEPLLAVVDSSYRLLDEPDRRVLERLAVFPSDFDLEAAEVVAASGGPGAIARLVDKSLVSRVGSERYRLLGATRVYAGRRLEEREQTSAARSLHAHHYLELAETAAAGFMTSEEARWMRVVAAEMDNMRSVQRRVIEGSSTEEALRLATALTHYAQWHVAPEPFDWAAEAVKLEGASDHPLYSAALGAVALAATNRGELERAVSLAGQALAREGSSTFVKLTPMRALCLAALYRRQVDECHRLGAELEEMAKESEMPFYAVDSLLIRASVEVMARRPEATSHVRHALTASQRLGVPSLIAFANELMGEAVHDSHPDEALDAFQRAQEIADEVSCRLVSGLALLGSGSTLMKLGRFEESGQRLRQSVLHWRRAGNVTLQWTTLRYVAELLARLDYGDTARRILAAADLDDRAPQVAGAQAERLATVQKKLGLSEQAPPTLDGVGAEAVRALDGIMQRVV